MGYFEVAAIYVCCECRIEATYPMAAFEQLEHVNQSTN